MAKCIYCNSKKGKRKCVALDGLICPKCCGTNYITNISCNEECSYLSKLKETKLRKTTGNIINENLNSANPDLIGYDILCKTNTHADFTYNLETFFLKSYLNGARINDQTIKDLLSLIYIKYYYNYNEPINSDNLFIQNYLNLFEKIKQSYEDKIPVNEQGLIILRLILSIKKTSGAQFGDCGYLNYIKNNIYTNKSNDSLILEDKFGNIYEDKDND